MPWLAADIGIKGERIVAIGKLSDATAKRVIDATGHFVAPGFIDAHAHAAPALAQAKTAGAAPLLLQGITTVLVNPDGGGPTDLAAQRQAISKQQPGVNVVQMIGHNAVRSQEIGRASCRERVEGAVGEGTVTKNKNV